MPIYVGRYGALAVYRVAAYNLGDRTTDHLQVVIDVYYPVGVDPQQVDGTAIVRYRTPLRRVNDEFYRLWDALPGDGPELLTYDDEDDD